MINNGLESQRIQDRQITFGMYYHREHWHKCVKWFYKRREITAAWEA
jgi:hypothetical protein